ncbi:MAG: MarR family transcriptional regulator [Thermus sp.]
MSWTILTQLWRLNRVLREETLPTLEALGLAPTDPWLLAELEHHPYPSLLVHKTQIPPPTISHMLKRLERLGLVKRRLEPQDLRRYRFELTEKGRQALEESRKAMQKALEKRLDRLMDEEKTLLEGILDRLLEEERGEVL